MSVKKIDYNDAELGKVMFPEGRECKYCTNSFYNISAYLNHIEKEHMAKWLDYANYFRRISSVIVLFTLLIVVCLRHNDLVMLTGREYGQWLNLFFWIAYPTIVACVIVMFLVPIADFYVEKKGRNNAVSSPKTLLPHEYRECLLTEYEEAHRYAIHLDTLNWQVGSILIGGSLAAVAVASRNADIMKPIGAAAIVALFCWLLFIRRNGGFSGIATGRMVEIENELGLRFQSSEQQGRKNGYTIIGSKPIRLPGPRGFHTASLLVIGIIGALALIIIKSKLCYPS